MEVRGKEGRLFSGRFQRKQQSFGEVSLARKGFALQLKLAVTHFAACPLLTVICLKRPLRDRRSLFWSLVKVQQASLRFSSPFSSLQMKAFPSSFPLDERMHQGFERAALQQYRRPSQCSEVWQLQRCSCAHRRSSVALDQALWVLELQVVSRCPSGKLHENSRGELSWDEIGKKIQNRDS